MLAFPNNIYCLGLKEYVEITMGYSWELFFDAIDDIDVSIVMEWKRVVRESGINMGLVEEMMQEGLVDQIGELLGPCRCKALFIAKLVRSIENYIGM